MDRGRPRRSITLLPTSAPLTHSDGTQSST
jgi:hypothetical protein